MPKQKQKVIVVLGQTSTGKSGLAVGLAKKFGGEVISADSRQVYRGLDLGTGKITKKEMHGVPHHLIDVAGPKLQFSVAEYKKLAETAIADILKRGKVPIICGGTGLYIDAVANGIVLPEVVPNLKLRKKLEKKSTAELFKILKNIDAGRAKNIDAKNPRRLIRAIEIAQALGRVPVYHLQPTTYNLLKIGLMLPDENLRQKIHKRLLSRIKQGMVDEAERLHKQGLSWRRMNELGLEYRYLAQYLNKKISKQEMLYLLEKEIWQYAKRQKTWFKRDKDIKWFEPVEIKKVEKWVKNFLSN